MANQDSAFRRQVWLGVGLLLLAHLVGAAMSRFQYRDFLGMDSLIFIGFWQALYVGPAVIIAAVLKKTGVVVGLLIGAGVTLLLSFLTCSGFALGAFNMG